MSGSESVFPGLSEPKGHLSDSSEPSASHVSSCHFTKDNSQWSLLLAGRQTRAQLICPLLPGDQQGQVQDHRSGGPWKEPHWHCLHAQALEQSLEFLRGAFLARSHLYPCISAVSDGKMFRQADLSVIHSKNISQRPKLLVPLYFKKHPPVWASVNSWTWKSPC